MNTLNHIACTRIMDAQLKQQALQQGFVVDDKDLLHIELLNTPHVIDTVKNNIHPIVFTSQYGVMAVVDVVKKNNLTLHNSTTYCISGKTAKLAAEAGFTVLDSAPNSAILAGKIAAAQPQITLLHAGANLALTNWKTFLDTHQIQVTTLEVYHKTLKPEPFEKVDAVLFFSPSQIDAFLQSNVLANETPAFCIGETTAKHLLQTQHKNTLVATEPSEQALLNQVYQYFNS